jgi:hypothetical protein
MRERTVTLLCATGALVLFLTLFMRGNGLSGPAEPPRPTTEERGGNGYHAALQWLDVSNIRVLSHRDRLYRLPDRAGLSRTGNLLIVTLPARVAFWTSEFRWVDRWVRAGNTLLVLAALCDSPDWAAAQGGVTVGDLNLLTGLDFVAVARAVTSGSSTSSGCTLLANRPHAYFSGMRQAVAPAVEPAKGWSVQLPYDGFVFELAHGSETGDGVLWTRPLGSGRIIVIGLGSVFTNRALGMSDNAQLLANIVSANLSADGVVVFDDAHQGLSAGYDPAKFFHDTRLYLTIGVAALLWLAWVVGGTRLRRSSVRVAAPREADLVRATGAFLARVLTPAAAARRLFEHFLRRFPWEMLERHPRLAPADLQQLKSWHAAASASERVPLVRAHNLMWRLTRQLES